MPVYNSDHIPATIQAIMPGFLSTYKTSRVRQVSGSHSGAFAWGQKYSESGQPLFVMFVGNGDHQYRFTLDGNVIALTGNGGGVGDDILPFVLYAKDSLTIDVKANASPSETSYLIKVMEFSE